MKKGPKRDWAERAAERWLNNPSKSKYSAFDLAKLLRRFHEWGKQEGLLEGIRVGGNVAISAMKKRPARERDRSEG